MATHSTPPAPTEPHLSLADVQRRYPGLSARSARRFMREVGAIEVGRQPFVRVEDLLAFEASRAATARGNRSAPPAPPRPRGYWMGEVA